MTTKSLISQDLISAYETTNFHVSAEPDFILTVNKHNIELQNFYEEHNVLSAAFITAWNPFSNTLSQAQNIERNSQLQKEFINQGYDFLNGYGQHPLKDWPAEESYLVLRLGLEDAKVIGAKYEQNAIVWCDSDAIPQLILLR